MSKNKFKWKICQLCGAKGAISLGKAYDYVKCHNCGQEDLLDNWDTTQARIRADKLFELVSASMTKNDKYGASTLVGWAEDVLIALYGNYPPFV